MPERTEHVEHAGIPRLERNDLLARSEVDAHPSGDLVDAAHIVELRRHRKESGVQRLSREIARRTDLAPLIPEVVDDAAFGVQRPAFARARIRTHVAIDVFVDAAALLEPCDQREQLVRRSDREAGRSAVLLVDRIDLGRVPGVRVAALIEARVLRHRQHVAGLRFDLHTRGTELHVVHARGGTRGHRLLGRVLEVVVERRVDLEPAAGQHVGTFRGSGFDGDPALCGGPCGARLAAERLVVARIVEDRVLHVLAEVRGALCRRTPTLAVRQVRLDRLLDGGVVLLLRDRSLFQHAPQDGVAPVLCTGVPVLLAVLRVLRLIQTQRRWIVHDARERRGLVEVQILGRLRVIPLCGRFDTVGDAAEVDEVQVADQDLLLGVLLLDRDRVSHLLQLALVPLRAGGRHGLVCTLGEGLHVLRRPLAGLHLHALDVLLADRGSALGRLGERVVEERAGGSDEVDAAVLVVARILGRQEGVVDVVRDLVVLDGDAVLVVERRELVVVVSLTGGGVDRRRFHRSVDLEVAGKTVEQ